MVAVLALALSLAAPLPAAGQGPRPRLLLSAQTSWVEAGGDFSLLLRVEGAARPSDLELAVRVYPAVATRSEFQLTLADRLIGAPVASPPPAPLTSLPPDPNGDVTLRLPLQDPSKPRDLSRIFVGRKDGVYPVRVELRRLGDGPVIDQFTTHLVYLPSDPGSPLSVALVLPIHAPPALQANGSRRIRNFDGLAALGQALDAVREVPFTLAPTPETLDALAASTDDRAAATLAQLRRAAATHPVLTRPYVPVNLPALSGAGMDDEVGAQLAQGSRTVAEVLRTQPEGRTWLAEDALDATSLARLRGLGFERLVVSEAGLTTLRPQKLTLTRPYLVDGFDGRRHLAASVDTELASHFADQGDPVLRAHQFLADLAVLYLDQPGSGPRGVVAVPARAWRPDRRFVETALAGLVRFPVAQPVTVDTLFQSVTAARGEVGAHPPRRTAGRSSALADLGNRLRTIRRRVDALGSVLDRDNPAYVLLTRRLLVALSAELRTARQRDDYLDGAQKAIDDQLDAIRMPSGRSITLTDRRGEIPLTFRNDTGHPVRVVARLESEKLVFPRGTELRLDLVRRNTTERFSVQARTSGAFPLRVSLESPDGRLVIGRTRLTVRSTATSRLGLLLSVGAVLFLTVWWGRHLLGGRRARRLVPA